MFFGKGFPITLKQTLKFCPYNGSSCCNSTQDVKLQKEFQSMNISDPACASVVKSVLCAVSLSFPSMILSIICFSCSMSHDLLITSRIVNRKTRIMVAFD